MQVCGGRLYLNHDPKGRVQHANDVSLPPNQRLAASLWPFPVPSMPFKFYSDSLCLSLNHGSITQPVLEPRLPIDTVKEPDYHPDDLGA